MSFIIIWLQVLFSAGEAPWAWEPTPAYGASLTAYGASLRLPPLHPLGAHADPSPAYSLPRLAPHKPPITHLLRDAGLVLLSPRGGTKPRRCCTMCFSPTAGVTVKNKNAETPSHDLVPYV